MERHALVQYVGHKATKTAIGMLSVIGTQQRQ